MKILIISLLMTTISGCTGTNSQEHQNKTVHFILLKDSATISLNTFKDEKINEITHYPASKSSIYCTDGITNIAILNTEKHELIIHDFINATKKTFAIPFEIKPITIFLKDNNLFIGGSIETEMLIQFNFITEKWFALHVPEQVSFKNKAIDDIVFFNDMLVAVDNIVMPKYLLYYNYSADKKCEYSHLFQLKENGTYESYKKAYPTDEYLGLYSTTYGRMGRSCHISLYNINDMSMSFAFSTTTKRGDPPHIFNDFCIINNTLYIADNQNGLGKLDNIGSHLTSNSGRYGNARISTTLISYTVFEGEEVVRLHAVDNTNKLIITLQNKKGEYRHVVYEVEE